jgi:hypothetical protein
VIFGLLFLLGAELNAELAKESREGGVQPKELPPHDDERAISPLRLIAPHSTSLRRPGLYGVPGFWITTGYRGVGSRCGFAIRETELTF